MRLAQARESRCRADAAPGPALGSDGGTRPPGPIGLVPMTDGFAVEVDEGVIVVSGDLDAQTSGRLDDVIAGRLDIGVDELVFDMGGLEFIDSSGLRSLVLARGDGDRRVVLRSPSASVVRLLDITGLLDVFTIEH